MIANVKITLLICLTFITSTVLFLSYSEYNHRYELITTQNNGIYIFDKKTTTLNKCENGKCETIQTNFPADHLLGNLMPTNVSVQATPQATVPTQLNVAPQSRVDSQSRVASQAGLFPQAMATDVGIAPQIPSATQFRGRALSMAPQASGKQVASNPNTISNSQVAHTSNRVATSSFTSVDGLPTLQGSLASVQSNSNI